MYREIVSFVLFIAYVQAVLPTGFISSSDKQRIKSVFDSYTPFTDLSSAHFTLAGYKLLGVSSPNAEKDCKYLKDNIDATNVKSIYHVTEASKLISGCKVTIPNAQSTLTKSLDSLSTQEIFYGVASLKNLRMPVDAKKVSSSLSAALKKDDAQISLGYAFHAASLLSGDLTSFYDRIEDVIVQADEVDGKYLQFEGGIGITGIIFSGIYKLSESAKKAPPLTNDQVAKFTNYLLNRRSAQTVRGLYYLLYSLEILTSNKFHVPVSVTLASNVALSHHKPIIQVRVTDVLGKPLAGKFTVMADTVIRVKDGAVIISKEPFTESKTGGSLFEVDLTKKAKNLMGMYKITVNAVPKKPDPRLVGNAGSPISVNFMVEADIRDVEVGTAEIDQSSSPTLNKAAYPNKMAAAIQADSHQIIIVKCNLKNKDNGEALTAHQVFLQLTNKKTNQEITFVHEHNEKGNYKFNIDLKTKASDFGHLSGQYSMALLVGDRFLSNSYNWNLADVSLTFSDDLGVKKSENLYVAKPEIKHVFREPEKRPSEFVSNFFTGLVFVPILILIIMWIKIGVNISNFPLSMGAIGFHLGLGGIFGLFLYFWLKLNMFVTIKYLVGLGIVTFLCGNNLLSKLAKMKK